MSCKLSVILPLYNQAHCIEGILQSLFSQSIELEVIVIDDASTDGGGDVVKKLAAQAEKELRLLRNETRLRTMHSRLRGLEAAKMPWVMFVDGDDSLVGTHNLQQALEELQEADCDIGHFRTRGYSSLHEPTFQDSPWTMPLAEKLSGNAIFSAYAKRHYLPANLWGKIYRRSFLQEVAKIVHPLPIKRFDDKCIVSVAMLLAESYMGSNVEIYNYTPNTSWPMEKFAARLQDLYTIHDTMLVLMKEKNIEQADKENFSTFIAERICFNGGRLAILLEQMLQDDSQTIENLIQRLNAYIDSHTLIQALTLANARNVSKNFAIQGCIYDMPSLPVQF